MNQWHCIRLQAGHALVGSLMPEYDPVTKISIVPRGAAGGLTFFAPSEERLESGLYSRSYLENQMAVAMGGRVAEELIFGPDDVTTGASGDFQQVCVDHIWSYCVLTSGNYGVQRSPVLSPVQCCRLSVLEQACKLA